MGPFLVRRSILLISLVYTARYLVHCTFFFSSMVVVSFSILLLLFCCAGAFPSDRRARHLPRRGPPRLHLAYARPPRHRRRALRDGPCHPEAPPGLQGPSGWPTAVINPHVGSTASQVFRVRALIIISVFLTPVYLILCCSNKSRAMLRPQSSFRTA